MTTVDLRDADTQLSRLVARVEGGEEVVIARAGRPIARLVPVQPAGPRRPGALKGRIRIDETFHDPLPSDEVDAWEG